MNDPDLDEFRHMWDASEDWELHKYEHRTTSLTVRFATHEPTLQEIAMMRKLLPEYERTPPRVLRELIKSSGRLDLEPLSTSEAEVIAKRGRQLGLKIDTRDILHVGYLPVSRTGNGVMIIEDEVLAERVWTEMLKHGVPVVNR